LPLPILLGLENGIKGRTSASRYEIDDRKKKLFPATKHPF
jgi:hypothetical protein